VIGGQGGAKAPRTRKEEGLEEKKERLGAIDDGRAGPLHWRRRWWTAPGGVRARGGEVASGGFGGLRPFAARWRLCAGDFAACGGGAPDQEAAAGAIRVGLLAVWRMRMGCALCCVTVCSPPVGRGGAASAGRLDGAPTVSACVVPGRAHGGGWMDAVCFMPPRCRRRPDRAIAGGSFGGGVEPDQG
jgi:hypothetical protein